jgi:hypothetical protein
MMSELRRESEFAWYYRRRVSSRDLLPNFRLTTFKITPA